MFAKLIEANVQRAGVELGIRRDAGFL